MKLFFFISAFWLIGISCTPDGNFETLYKDDSTLADSAGVDTFSVKRPQVLTDAEKKQSAIDKKETDSVESVVSNIIHQNDPEKSDKIYEENNVVANPDIGPSFPGGQDAMDAYITKKRIYPLVAFQSDVKGTVNVKFVVNGDGEIAGIKVIKSLGYGCDEEAMDMVREMPHWIPGKKGGANVRCVVILPISFGD